MLGSSFSKRLTRHPRSAGLHRWWSHRIVRLDHGRDLVGAKISDENAEARTSWLLLFGSCHVSTGENFLRFPLENDPFYSVL